MEGRLSVCSGLRPVACVSHVGVGMVLTATLSHSLFTSSSSSRGARSRLQLLAILGSGRDLGQAISASCLWVLLCVPSWLTWQSYLPDASLPAECCVAQPPVLLHIKQKWWTSNQWIKQQIVAGKARPLAGLHRPPAVVPEELPS